MVPSSSLSDPALRGVDLRREREILVPRLLMLGGRDVSGQNARLGPELVVVRKCHVIIYTKALTPAQRGAQS